jgi:RNA polymerase sigma-70 factor (ECF subfamily)
MATRAPTTLEQHLGDSRDRYLGFVRSKIADPELAEDVLQDAIVNALRAAPEIEGDQRLASWFYRVLRNAVVDAYRRREVRGRRAAPLDGFDVAEPTEADDAALCECLRPLIASLKPEYADVLTSVDLGQEAPGEFAARARISPESVKVRRHRARKALRERLLETCRLCADHGCLDCTCS